MEQVICLILGKRLCWTSMEEVNPMRIEPNMEDIVEEFFHRLKPVADGLVALLMLPIDEVEEEEEETEESEEVTNRKEKVSQVHQILEGIMETTDQKLDQGKYL